MHMEIWKNDLESYKYIGQDYKMSCKFVWKIRDMYACINTYTYIVSRNAGWSLTRLHVHYLYLQLENTRTHARSVIEQGIYDHPCRHVNTCYDFITNSTSLFHLTSHKIFHNYTATENIQSINKMFYIILSITNKHIDFISVRQCNLINTTAVSNNEILSL